MFKVSFLVLLLFLYPGSPGSDPLIAKLAPLDVKLAPPRPGEWLYERNEKGQTFDQYKTGKPFLPSELQQKIYLQPIGKFTAIQKEIIGYTADYLRVFFNRKVVVLPVKVDDFVPETGRRGQQLQTVAILDVLEKAIPADAIGIMAITSRDLFPGTGWNFVFGQARPNKRVCVSSLYRYSPPQMNHSDYQLSLARLIKTSSHEIGHMLSVLHCTHAVCLMNGSNSLAEADQRPNRLCSQCLSKLQWNLKFPVKPRAVQLRDFFARHNLDGDLQLAVRDLQVLR